MNQTTTWYDAIDCKEHFKDFLDDPSHPEYNELRREFPIDERWICPNVDRYTLLNNPYLFEGNNFVVIVNECNTATYVDEEYNVTTYTNSTCWDTDTIDEYLEYAGIRVRYKAVQHTFSPEHYANHNS